MKLIALGLSVTLMIVAIPLQHASALTTRTVKIGDNAGAGCGGDTCDYNNWEVAVSNEAEYPDLVDGDERVVFELWNYVETHHVTVTGYSADTTHNIVFQCMDLPAESSGIYSEDRFRFYSQPDTGGSLSAVAMYVPQSHVVINDVQIRVEANNSSVFKYGMSLDGDDVAVHRAYIWLEKASGATYDIGTALVRGNYSNNDTPKVYNSILRATKNANNVRPFKAYNGQSNCSGSFYFYNVSVVGDWANGIYKGAYENLYGYNVLVDIHNGSSTNCIYPTNLFSGQTNACNCSSTSCPGTNSLPNSTFTFVSSSDFHLDASDTGANGLGSNYHSIYDADIDGEGNRPSSGNWDIGADEN